MTRPTLKPIRTLKPIVKAICPNPNVSISLPPRITFGCR